MMFSPRFELLCKTMRTSIAEIRCDQLAEKRLQHAELLLVDVREEAEWQLGHIDGAIWLSCGRIEREIERLAVLGDSHPIVVYSKAGFRSVLTANYLQMMGYTQVFSLQGGLNAWLDAGWPETPPDQPITD